MRLSKGTRVTGATVTGTMLPVGGLTARLEVPDAFGIEMLQAS